MSEIKLLLKLHIKSLLGINRLRHSRQSHARLKLAGLLTGLTLLCLFVMVLSGGYSVLLATALAPIDNLDAIPVGMLAIGSLLTLITSVSHGGEQLLAFRDYDIQMSLPVSPGKIALSRLIIAYGEPFAASALVLLPAFGVYVWYARPAAGTYVTLLFALVLSPALPVIAGTLTSGLIARVSARFRGTKYLRILLSLGFLAAYFVFCFSFEGDEEQLTAMVISLSAAVTRFYPPAMLLARALKGSPTSLFLFIALSLGAFTLSSLFYAHFLRPLHSIVTEKRARSHFRMKHMTAKPPLKALYKREVSRYLSSTVYVLNTVIGPLMGLVAGAALLIAGRETVAELSNLPVPGMNHVLPALAPCLITFFIATGITSASSVSLEGGSRFLIQCIPAPAITVFRAKILLSLTVLSPLFTVVPAMVSLALAPDPVFVVLMFLMPFAASVFLSHLGLLLNLRLHRFDWKNEQQVVKQSAAVGITMLIGTVLALLPAVLTFIFPASALLISALTTVCLLLFSLAFSALLRARAEKALLTL